MELKAQHSVKTSSCWHYLGEGLGALATRELSVQSDFTERFLCAQPCCVRELESIYQNQKVTLGAILLTEVQNIWSVLINAFFFSRIKSRIPLCSSLPSPTLPLLGSPGGGLCPLPAPGIRPQAGPPTPPRHAHTRSPRGAPPRAGACVSLLPRGASIPPYLQGASLPRPGPRLLIVQTQFSSL